MPKWTEYTSKDTLADNDEVMLYDATGRANKRGLMSKFWDYVVDKMSTAVISKLETKNKTIIGALNYLNGKAVSSSSEYITNLNEAKTTGFYYFQGDATNAPTRTTAGNLIVIASNASISQIAVVSNRLFIRRFAGSSWNEWAEK